MLIWQEWLAFQTWFFAISGGAPIQILCGERSDFIT